MKNVLFGLISNAQYDEITSCILRELTVTWTRYGYQGEIIQAQDMDALLQKVAETNYAFCLVQTAGHIIDECWYPAHWNRKGFYDALELLMRQDFLVAAELDNSDKKYPGIKTDCLLVNMNMYKEAGMPLFGGTAAAVHSLNGWGKEVTEAIPQLPGWNFVNVSTQLQLPIIDFPVFANNNRLDLNQDADRNNFHFYLRKELTDIDETFLSESQIRFLRKIKIQLDNSRKSVFLWNIESYDDVVLTEQQTIGTCFCVASGFKPMRLVETLGSLESTNVVYYDYSQTALQVRKFLVENWDGDDFPHFIKYIFQKFPYPETHYQLWEGVTPDNLSWQDVDWFWQQEILKWGTAENFKNTWNAYRRLKHEYLLCNLLTDTKPLLKAIAAADDPYIWWSNAFFTVYSNWLFSFNQRKNSYEDWIKKLSGAKPDCYINGSDYNNTSVNGITAGDYFEQLIGYSGSDLTINKCHKHSIRY